MKDVSNFDVSRLPFLLRYLSYSEVFGILPLVEEALGVRCDDVISCIVTCLEDLKDERKKE